MGIKGLLKWLKEEVPEAFGELPISSFAQNRIPVDLANWVQVYISPIYKEMVLNAATLPDPVDGEVEQELVMGQLRQAWLRFNMEFMNVGITLLWVGDGVPYPEKTITKEKRRTATKKGLENIENAKIQLRAVPAILRHPNALSELRKIRANYCPFKNYACTEIENFATTIGAAFIRAPGDGEHYCAQLCIEGLAIAGWSRDTDCQAIGAPITITDMAGYTESRERVLSVVYTPVIYAKLGLTREQFTNLCIMMGTDFNENIRLIGPAKSFKHLKDNGWSIEQYLSKSGKDGSCLNLERTREIMMYRPTGLSNEDPRLCVNHSTFLQNGYILFQTYRLDSWYRGFFDAMRCVTTPKRVSFVTAESSSSSSQEDRPPRARLEIVDAVRDNTRELLQQLGESASNRVASITAPLGATFKELL